MPVRIDEMVVVGRLSLGPTVEGLVQDHQAHGVGQVEEFWRRRVMRRPESVGAHLLQGLELTLGSPIVDSGADGALVMVIASSLNVDVLAVDQQALVRI